jgi:DNA polymerase III sliding clamp (beta) subunit (PCNA family)
MPEYEKVMTKAHATHIIIPIDFVRTFLKRALLLESHLIVISHKTDNSLIRFIAETAEYGRTLDTCFAEIQGEKEFEIRMCPKRLSGLLKQFKSGDTLIMKLKKEAATSPVDIGIKENPATQIMIMPMVV